MLNFFEKRAFLWVTHLWNMFDFAADTRKAAIADGMSMEEAMASITDETVK